MFFHIFTFLLLLCASSTHALTLKEQLQKAKKGDYIVVFQDRSYTLLDIYSKTETTLQLEEVTVGETQINRLKKKEANFSWRQWLLNGAPKHTSWVIYEIELASGKIEEAYSYSRKTWIDLAQIENFLPTLLNLPFHQIPDKNRKRIGLQPLTGDTDNRPLWNPEMTFEGKTIPHVVFDAYKALWPRDGSSLAGKSIEIYLPHNQKEFPSYFPYWLQITETLTLAKIRVVDTGTNLISPSLPIPRRQPIHLQP